jgi:hypothetical protein
MKFLTLIAILTSTSTFVFASPKDVISGTKNGEVYQATYVGGKYIFRECPSKTVPKGDKPCENFKKETVFESRDELLLALSDGLYNSTDKYDNFSEYTDLLKKEKDNSAALLKKEKEIIEYGQTFGVEKIDQEELADIREKIIESKAALNDLEILAPENRKLVGKQILSFVNKIEQAQVSVAKDGIEEELIKFGFKSRRKYDSIDIPTTKSLINAYSDQSFGKCEIKLLRNSLPEAYNVNTSGIAVEYETALHDGGFYRTFTRSSEIEITFPDKSTKKVVQRNAIESYYKDKKRTQRTEMVIITAENSYAEYDIKDIIEKCSMTEDEKILKKKNFYKVKLAGYPFMLDQLTSAPSNKEASSVNNSNRSDGKKMESEGTVKGNNGASGTAK